MLLDVFVAAYITEVFHLATELVTFLLVLATLVPDSDIFRVRLAYQLSHLEVHLVAISTLPTGKVLVADKGD